MRDCKNFRLKVDTHTHAIRSRSVAELQYKLRATQQQHLARDIHSRWPVGLSQLIFVLLLSYNTPRLGSDDSPTNYNTHCMPPFPLCTLAPTHDHPTPRPTAGVLAPKRVRRVASCMIQSSCWGFSFSRPGNWLMAILLHLLTAGKVYSQAISMPRNMMHQNIGLFIAKNRHRRKPTSRC